MNIKYELHAINNVEGKGFTRSYVRLFTDSPSDEKAMGQAIQANCTLTEADLRAALVAIGRQMADELKRGRRFHIPEVGYFSLSAKIDTAAGKNDGTRKSERIRVRSIRFRPETAMMDSIRRDVKFEKATVTSKSKVYDTEEMRRGIKEYLAQNRCMTRRDMERTFMVRGYTARKWLKTFVEEGMLRKEGAHNSPVYIMARPQGTATQI